MGSRPTCRSSVALGIPRLYHAKVSATTGRTVTGGSTSDPDEARCRRGGSVTEADVARLWQRSPSPDNRAWFLRHLVLRHALSRHSRPQTVQHRASGSRSPNTPRRLQRAALPWPHCPRAVPVMQARAATTSTRWEPSLVDDAFPRPQSRTFEAAATIHASVSGESLFGYRRVPWLLEASMSMSGSGRIARPPVRLQ